MKIRRPKYVHSLKMDIVISKQPTIREMLQRYLRTGELPELMQDPSDSFDFEDETKVDFSLDPQRRADISDYIRRKESPQETAQETAQETPKEAPKQPAEQAAPATDLTNGAD